MTLFQTNIFSSLTLLQDQSCELVDIFTVSGEKTITLQSNSSLTYLIVGMTPDIHLRIVTAWPHCSCKIFGLFPADAKHPVMSSLNVSIKHAYVVADVELISFLYDGAKVAIDGCIDIDPLLDTVHGRLFEHNIILWKDISIQTTPKLNVASHQVSASHGANIDMLDSQKLFYMMSKGLTQQQSQTLLVNWSIEYILEHFDQCKMQNSHVLEWEECRKHIERMMQNFQTNEG